jgi:hypothetical protein
MPRPGVIPSWMMQISGVFLALGEDVFGDLLRRVSLGRLRTYQLFDQIKTRTHLMKLNNEHLRKAAPKLWARLQSGEEEDLAVDLSQAILVSHLDLIVEALNLLGIPHQDGFFAKDSDVKGYLTEGWQERVFEALKDKYPPSVVVFYLNHLGVETAATEAVFSPAAA